MALHAPPGLPRPVSASRARTWAPAAALGIALLAPALRAEPPAVQLPDPALLRGLMGQLAPQSDAMALLKREAARVAACMQHVDQDELAAVQAKVERDVATVRSLCASNRRDEAQRTAHATVDALLATPVVGELQRCDPTLADLEALLPWVGSSAQLQVCDLESAVQLPGPSR